MSQKLFQSQPLYGDVKPRSERKLRVSGDAELAIAEFASQLRNKGVGKISYSFNPGVRSLTFFDGPNDVDKLWVFDNIGGEHGNLPVDRLKLTVVMTGPSGMFYLMTEADVLTNQEELERLNELGPNDNLSN